MAFIAFSLPRSRSAWMSVFLSHGGRQVSHDLGPDCRSVQDFMERLKHGTCETGAAFAWPVIKRLRPDLKVLVIKRDVAEVCDSLERFGLVGYRPEMLKRALDLREISAEPNVLTVQYRDLWCSNVCQKVFEHCLEQPFDAAWWRKLDPLNIQVDMLRQLRKLADNRVQIELLKADVHGHA